MLKQFFIWAINVANRSVTIALFNMQDASNLLQEYVFAIFESGN